jgi:glutamyl-Q tRNA(Asp) synthetase
MHPPFADSLRSLPSGLHTRFAPSPTGHLHLGHVAAAAYVWGIAARVKATVHTRIEDHDQGRCRPAYITSIHEDLIWLGFLEAAAPQPPLQSQHFDRYAAYAKKLAHLTYICTCSRKQIAERTGRKDDELWYDGHCRYKGDTGPGGLRLILEADAVTFNDLALGPITQKPYEQCGDLLIRDRDGYWTYNFAVTVDDIEDGIDFIVRGEDILHATGRRALFGCSAIPHILHHPLIWESPDKKMSKRDGSASLAAWRAEGYSAEGLLGKALFTVGLIPEERNVRVADLETLFG